MPKKSMKKLRIKKILIKKKSSKPKVSAAVKAYVKKATDKAIEDKVDIIDSTQIQTFAAFSATSSSGVISTGHLTLPVLPDFSQGLTSGGTTGGYIGNEVKIKYVIYDLFIWPQINAETYGRTIRIDLIKLKGPNANTLFDTQDMFDNDYALSTLNNVNYPDQFWLTLRNNRADNYKRNYSITKTWYLKVPNSISGVDGANWNFSKKLYCPIGHRIRYDNSGNPIDYDYRLLIRTDVGNDYTSAPGVAVSGTITTAGSTGCQLLYQRKIRYEDA